MKSGRINRFLMIGPPWLEQPAATGSRSSDRPDIRAKSAKVRVVPRGGGFHKSWIRAVARMTQRLSARELTAC
jgi:hypothetical protein